MNASIRIPFLLACAVLLGILIGCSSHEETSRIAPELESPPIDLGQLAQHWVHSYEEDGEPIDGQVYRPFDSWEFPPSWFRMAYVFHEGGDLEWMYLAPDDGHHLKPGSWELDPPMGPTVYVDAGGPHLFEILELTEDLLRLRENPIR